ncbi:testis-expressed protein 22 [Lagenorhynchus albirostris]|uniref:testis-expressed protein 22 n=1 Tax=Lagenorhynchus albirostris TaxID=27610 RepID=UPI0028E989B5|nr:testis-expressed protein 22 [Lagenorhynchus albirostris]
MEWRGAGCRLLRRLHAWSCGRGAQSLDLGVWPGGVEVAVGTYPQSPRGAGEPPKGLEMDSGKRLFKAFLGKMPESQPQPSQENGQPSAPPSPAVAWGQPGAPSSSQQVLQTQDWEDSEPLRHQGSPSPCFKRELTAKGTRHSGKISVMKESKTPGKKGVRRSTVPGRAQQSWRCVTIREVTCAILEILAHAAEQEGRRTRATAEEVMPASRETRDCAPPAQESGLESTHSRGFGKRVQTTARKSNKFQKDGERLSKATLGLVLQLLALQGSGRSGLDTLGSREQYIGSRRTTVTGGGGRLPSAPCNSPLSSEFLLPRTFPSCKPEAAPRPRPALAASIPCSDSTDLMTLGNSYEWAKTAVPNLFGAGVRDAGEQAPSRRWNVSIDERWRLAVLGGGERPGLAGATLSYRDLAQTVAQLVSQDEDKGVLLPHPPRSAESSSAFQAFLVRSAPFWHNVALEAQAARSPPS